MRRVIPGVVASAAVVSAAVAGEAVQWRVEDGGNGHWYQVVLQRRPFAESANHAISVGGYLAEIDSSAENSFCFGLASADLAAWYLPTVGFGQGPYVGSHRVSTGEWVHLSGASIGHSGWCSGQPDDYGGSQSVATYWAPTGQPSSCWDDVSPEFVNSSIVEWSADCNGDGIVDFGQCRDGTLADINSNNVPDCCEAGQPCVASNYPVQWRVSDGGNGHWYLGLRLSEDAVSWTQARANAQALGGELAQLETRSELDWVYATVASNPDLWRWTMGPWLGGLQPGGSEEPTQGWRWINGARIDPTMWAPGEPVDYVLCGEHENHLNLFCNVGCEAYPVSSPRPTVNDVPESGFCDCCNNGKLRVWVNSAIIEWSADCNGDGIVDYGQILQGQLADANDNGVPDSCESPTCADADLYPNGAVNGADLGIMLSEWGAVTPATSSDLNRDGTVDGSDLGILLAFWGPCTP
jgi:hypothetical protein